LRHLARVLASIVIAAPAGCAGGPSVIRAPWLLTQHDEAWLGAGLARLSEGPLAVRGPPRPSDPVTDLPRRLRADGRWSVGPACIEPQPGPTMGGAVVFDRCPREALLIFGPDDDGIGTRIEVWVQGYETSQCETVQASPNFMSHTRCTLVPRGDPAGDEGIARYVESLVGVLAARGAGPTGRWR
jgi:hypothetical protein